MGAQAQGNIQLIIRVAANNKSLSKMIIHFIAAVGKHYLFIPIWVPCGWLRQA